MKATDHGRDEELVGLLQQRGGGVDELQFPLPPTRGTLTG
jgi:hypothetical protein